MQSLDQHLVQNLEPYVSRSASIPNFHNPKPPEHTTQRSYVLVELSFLSYFSRLCHIRELNAREVLVVLSHVVGQPPVAPWFRVQGLGFRVEDLGFSA